jgi:hypothetical protein
MFAFWTHVTDNLSKSRILDFVTGYNLYVKTVGTDISFTNEDNGLVLNINEGELLSLHFFSFLSQPIFSQPETDKPAIIKLFNENE